MAYYNGRLTLGGVAGVYASVDDALSDTSENPVQNKVITNAVCLKADVATNVLNGNTNPVTSGAVYKALKQSDSYLATGTLNGTIKAAERAKIAYISDRVVYPEAPIGAFSTDKNHYYNLGVLTADISINLPAGGLYGDEIRVDFVNGSTAYNVTITPQSAAHTALSYTATANTAYSIIFTHGPIGAAGEQGWRAETKTFAAV